MSAQFQQLYTVPQTIDPDGTVWSKCLTDMDFISRDVGWVVGSGQILSTRDGGTTWKNHYSDYMARLLFQPRKVITVTDRSCCVIDIVGHGPVKCFYTDDFGEHWNAVQLGNLVYPRAITFKDSRFGWIVSDDGKVLNERVQIHITCDGGKTWEPNLLTIKGKPETIAFANSRTGWLGQRILSADHARSAAELYKSTDGGRTWKSITTFDQRILYVLALDANRVFVCGEHGFIAATQDGGHHWATARTGTDSAFNSIASDGDLRLIALGDFGTLVKSDNSGVTWRKLRRPADKNNIRAYIGSSDVIICSSTSVYLLN